MIIDHLVNQSEPRWRLDGNRQFKPNTALLKASSFDQPDDGHPDPAPATPGPPPWPRVFPGL